MVYNRRLIVPKDVKSVSALSVLFVLFFAVCPETVVAADADLAEISTSNMIMPIEESVVQTSQDRPVIIPFTTILPIPRSKRNIKIDDQPARKRKVGHAQLITSSPYQQALEESTAKKSKENCPIKAHPRERPASKIKKSTNTKTTKEAAKLRKPCEKEEQSRDDQDRTPCIYCEILYFQSNVPWIRCKRCERWACNDCVTLGIKKSSVCSDCS
jgi:hypothetical protein